MSVPRRQVLQLMAGAAALPALPRLTSAETYPSKPIRIIVQVGARSAPDIIARVAGQWMSDHIGQPVVIDNRPGASGNIATEAAVRSQRRTDTPCCSPCRRTASTPRSTTTCASVSCAIPRLWRCIGRIPLVMEVHPSVPLQTVPEFIAYAKANPGKINYASGGRGPRGISPARRCGTLRASTWCTCPTAASRGAARPAHRPGADHVRRGAVVAALTSRTARPRALAVSTEQPLDVLPDVPPMADYLPGYEASGCTASPPRRTRRRRLSSVSTRRSTPALRTRRPRRGSRTSAAWSIPARPPRWRSSWRAKSTSGPR